MGSRDTTLQGVNLTCCVVVSLSEVDRFVPVRLLARKLYIYIFFIVLEKYSFFCCRKMQHRCMMLFCVWMYVCVGGCVCACVVCPVLVCVLWVCVCIHSCMHVCVLPGVRWVECVRYSADLNMQ
jgi:hypothetical protein